MNFSRNADLKARVEKVFRKSFSTNVETITIPEPDLEVEKEANEYLELLRKVSENTRNSSSVNFG